MPRDYSPFTPGTPVSIELFAGRQEQIREMDRMIKQALSGKFNMGFLNGERGIGKSSLANYIRELAETNHELLGLHVFLGGVSDLSEMARRVFDRLVKDSIEKPWHDNVKKFLGDHVRKVGLFGVTVEFVAGSDELKQVVNDFVPSLRRLTRELEGRKKGLFIILDDINGLATSPDFANWLKSLVDEISVSRETYPLLILLVGLEERRRELIESQPSLNRVFQLIDVTPWTEEEAEQFFRSAFQSINIEVEDKAVPILVTFSQGLPTFAHEIGDAVLWTDRDDLIDKKDAMNGIYRAAEIIGRKYFEPQILNAIKSKNYYNILKLLIDRTAISFTRSELAAQLSTADKKNLDNFLRRMKELGVITPSPEEGKGAYRFTSMMMVYYLKIFANLPGKSLQ